MFFFCLLLGEAETRWVLQIWDGVLNRNFELKMVVVKLMHVTLTVDTHIQINSAFRV